MAKKSSFDSIPEKIVLYGFGALGFICGLGLALQLGLDLPGHHGDMELLMALGAFLGIMLGALLLLFWDWLSEKIFSGRI
jgi:hypothetical protein